MQIRPQDKLVHVPMVRIVFDDPSEFQQFQKLADEMGFDEYTWPMQMLRYFLHTHSELSSLMEAANDRLS